LNTLSGTRHSQPTLDTTFEKRRALSDWLERIGREIDITDDQSDAAREHYEAVGNWLAGSTHPWLANCSVYAHGSLALGTAVKPIRSDEYDLDAMSTAIKTPKSP
jgi:hypothetical protein